LEVGAVPGEEADQNKYTQMAAAHCMDFPTGMLRCEHQLKLRKLSLLTCDVRFVDLWF